MSDFDLRHRATTFVYLTQFLENSGIEHHDNVVLDLFHKKRKNLNAWLIRKKDSVIFNFGLDGTYDVHNKRQSEGKKTPIGKTTDELKTVSMEKANNLFLESTENPSPQV